jgi:serine/threonine protein kinase
MESNPATLAISPPGRDQRLCPSDDDILAYLPGELSGPQADSIAAHLASCPLCQTRVSTLRQRLTDQDRGPGAAAPAPAQSSEPSPLGSDSPLTVSYELRPQAGWRLNEYELLEPIGRGGMGVVYRARHVRLQRTVAVKVLPRLSLPDESAVVRMQRESAAAGRVQHPNIVYATDAGECDGAHYLVMEFVQGVDLSKLVALAGRLPIAEACEIARQAALGLGHIAECGLVHRDLKPSNLMLADDGSVKILDLGLALLHHNPLDDYEATQPGYLLGTADYIAPEQIDAPHEVDVRSDLYSLGCTLFKLLVGVAPFSGPEQNSVSRKVDAHRHRPPPRVSTLRPEVPAEVEQVLGRLLAKRPKDRFQRPSELAAALAPLAEGADLAALARRTREVSELEAPLGAPVDSRATTQSLGESATPRSWSARLYGLPVWAKVAAAVLLLGIVTASAFAVIPSILGDGEKEQQRVGGIVPPPYLPPAPKPNQIVYDLRQPVTQHAYIGWIESQPPYFNAQYNMLEVRPDAHQLLELGDYDGTPGKFAVTISQDNWHGAIGIYFGRRAEPRPRSRLTTFQVFVLEYFPGEITASGKPSFRLLRRRAFIPFHREPYLAGDAATAKTQSFTKPQSQAIRLEITFAKDDQGKVRCQRVAVNDEVLAELTTVDLNQQYLPEDYTGPFGLYVNGPSALGRNWFSNVVFTPAE